MNDDWIKIRFVDQIYLSDWPLTLLDRWVTLVTKNGYIISEIYNLFDEAYVASEQKTPTEFKKLLLGGQCNNKCFPQSRNFGESHKFTARCIRQKLVDVNQGRHAGLLDNEAAQRDILNSYFDKITYNIEIPISKTRIGVLVFTLTDQVMDEFTGLQNDVLVKQLSAKYYIMCAKSVLVENLFKCVKRSIDTVVIIVDSAMVEDPKYKILSQFSYLTIFLVKTADAKDTEAVLAHYRKIFPKNKLEIYDWFESPDQFSGHISKCIVPMKRFSIAFHSFFVRKKIRHE